jgi:hypothetical protein
VKKYCRAGQATNDSVAHVGYIIIISSTAQGGPWPPQAIDASWILKATNTHTQFV